MLDKSNPKRTKLKQISESLGDRWCKLQKGCSTRPATSCIEFTSVFHNKNALQKFAIDCPDMFEHG